jgi:hypothetical protein
MAKSKNNLSLLLTATAIFVMSIGPVFAAMNGMRGDMSMGNLRVGITKTEVAVVSGMSDMAIGDSGDGSNLTWKSTVCISKMQAGGYRIAADGNVDADGNFIIASGDKVIPYQVAWNSTDDSNAAENVALTPGVPLEVSQTDDDVRKCGTSVNATEASLVINIPQDAMQLARNENYTESLTVVIAPN